MRNRILERGIIELGIEDGKELVLGNASASLGGGVDEFIMEIREELELGQRHQQTPAMAPASLRGA